MNNLKRVENVLRYLAACDCREAVICAGARNAPLVVALGARTDLKVWSLFEERSAAFFALGRIKATGRPVAVVTTSGTAAAELLPALIEAHYSGLPLLAVTADRPPRYRGTGAPQAINQKNIFGEYTEACLDLWNDAPAFAWSGRRPLHLNVCLDEPSRAELESIDQHFGVWSSNPETGRSEAVAFKSRSQYEFVQQTKIDFFARCKKPVVIAGGLRETERAFVKSWLVKMNRPVYLEAPSGLCGDPELESQRIRGGERAVDWGLTRGFADGVIRIGGVPTARVWRDLEAKFHELPVVSFAAAPFSGLGREDARVLDLSELEHFHPPAHEWDLPWREIQSEAQWGLEALFEKYPRSEPGLVHVLARALPAGANVYLGNSLPIREWDLAAAHLPKNFSVEANRGANGIDGQLSTFLGWAGEDAPNWAVVGDLTALYDLPAPYLVRQRPLRDLNLVIINNRGGQIFSRMYGRVELENRHDLSFGAWAKMWDLHYEEWTAVPQALAAAPGPRVIELVPDDAATRDFLNEWEALWAGLSKR